MFLNLFKILKQKWTKSSKTETESYQKHFKIVKQNYRPIHEQKQASVQPLDTNKKVPNS